MDKTINTTFPTQWDRAMCRSIQRKVPKGINHLKLMESLKRKPKSRLTKK